MKRVFGDKAYNMTLEQIAQIEGVTCQRVQQIIDIALFKLKRKIIWRAFR